MQSQAATVDQYLGELPAERRAELEKVLTIVRENLDGEFEEGMQYGMIGWYVPHSRFPAGYHCDPKQPLPFAALASQKNHCSLYLMCLYGENGRTQKFQADWKATGKKLDMGKACIRFKRAEDLALDLIGEVLKEMTASKWIEVYQQSIDNRAAAKTASAKSTASAGKLTRKKASSTKAVKKKRASSE